MKVTNQKYPHLNLAVEDDRASNFISDFINSSFIAIFIIYFTHYNFLISTILYYSIRFIYYFLLEYFIGRTIGKYLTQTKVVDSKGNRPNIMQLIIRNMTRFFSLISGVNDKERAIHDQLSNTFVIKDEKLSTNTRVLKIIDVVFLIAISITFFYRMVLF